jgi:hypothetical protein
VVLVVQAFRHPLRVRQLVVVVVVVEVFFLLLPLGLQLMVVLLEFATRQHLTLKQTKVVAVVVVVSQQVAHHQTVGLV